jgi:hypothetical protein
VPEVKAIPHPQKRGFGITKKFGLDGEAARFKKQREAQTLNAEQRRDQTDQSVMYERSAKKSDGPESIQ